MFAQAILTIILRLFELLSAFCCVCKGIETAKVLNCWRLSSLLCAEHVCPGAVDYFFATFSAAFGFLHFRHVCKGIETAKVLNCW